MQNFKTQVVEVLELLRDSDGNGSLRARVTEKEIILKQYILRHSLRLVNTQFILELLTLHTDIFISVG